MRLITIMEGVRTGNPEHSARLFRKDSGRLVIVGSSIDMFDLVRWLDENSLSQFREIKPETPDRFEPSEPFKHLFNPDGTLK